MSPKVKNILIFVGIGVTLTLVYVFFLKPAPEQSSLQTVATPSLPNMDGTLPNSDVLDKNSLMAKDFLTILLSVKNIKLDDTLLSDPAFLGLHDSSITLNPDGTEGRPNPFAPIGSDYIPPVAPAPGQPGGASLPNNSNIQNNGSSLNNTTPSSLPSIPGSSSKKNNTPPLTP